MKRRSFKRSLFLSVSLVLSLILLAVSATFSWIIVNRPAKVDDVKIYVADTVDLALKSGEDGEDGISVNLDENFRHDLETLKLATANTFTVNLVVTIN